MKKVFIMAYTRVNLGDDLFICMLLKRYSKIQFYINMNDIQYAKAFENIDNINIVKSDNETFNRNIDYDAYIYIGGSIFMEGGKVYNLDDGCLEFMKKCRKSNVPFFYISSNFGPYHTDKYFNLSKETFKNCKDICFRDKYSYELFKDIESVRYAPDVAFNYKQSSQIDKIKDSIGISLIDLSTRENLLDKEEQYINLISNNITNFIKLGNKIYLFSFCKYEGDELGIDKVLDRVSDEYKNKINIIKYNGNIQEFLRKFGLMEYMICTRFHAMILSVVFKQKFYVISYSDKINNVIDDLNLCKNYLELKDISPNVIIDKSKFSEIKDTDLDNIVKMSEKQFEKLDEYMETLS